MTAKEYLSQAFYIDKKINLDIRKVRSMRDSLYGRNAKYEGSGSQRTSKDNSIENAIIKVLDYEKKIDREIDELVDKKLEIEAVIETVEDEKLKEILTRRYLQFQKFERISAEMHLELRWVYRLHKKALERIVVIDH